MPVPLFPVLYSIGSFFTGLVSGRNTDKTISNNRALEEARTTTQTELAKLQRETQLEINQDNLAFQRERLDREQTLQLQLSELNYQRQLEIASLHRDAQLALPETQKLFENWPLRIVPETILNAYRNRKVPPLRVFLSPPAVDFDRFVNPNPAIVQSATPANFPKIERRLANALHDVFNTYYPPESESRPVELLDGAWDSNRYCGGASLLALFSKLQSTPTLILDAEVIADNLTLWASYWGIGQEGYKRQKVLSNFPYRDILYESAKARALKWKTEVRDVLLAQGEKIEDIHKQYGGDNVTNLAILESDETDRRRGIKMKRNYQFNQDDWEDLCQVLGTYHVLVAGVIADSHFLLHHNTPLTFHTLVPDLLARHEETQITHIIEWMLTCYNDLFKVLSVERSYQVAELRMQLANSLAKLKNQEWAKRELAKSLTEWLQRRGVACKDSNVNVLLQSMFSVQPALFTGSKEFLEGLSSTLQFLGLRDESRKANGLISGLISLMPTRDDLIFPQAKNDMRITMLGTSGSGKTCYMLAMYAVMSIGIRGFTITTQKPDDNLPLRNLWERLKTTGEWPNPTSLSKDWSFDCSYGFNKIKGFSWHDYRGGALLDTSKPADREELLKKFKASQCVILCIDGEKLASFVLEQSRIPSEIRQFNTLMAKFVEQTNGKTVPVVIAITKADLCGEVLDKGVKAIKEKMLPTLFAPDSGWLVMICPVSLGRETSERFEINPVNVHQPVTFAILNALQAEIENQQTTGLRDVEYQTFQRSLGFLGKEFLGDALYMFFGEREVKFG